MVIEAQQLNVNHLLLKITISKDDYITKYNESLKKIKNNIILNGFRKGCVPLNFLERLHGKQLLIETLKKISNEALVNYIKENNLDVLAQLSDEDKVLENNIKIDDKPLEVTFSYELGLWPKFDLPTKDIEVEFFHYEITDNFIKEKVKELRKQFLTYDLSINQHIELEQLFEDKLQNPIQILIKASICLPNDKIYSFLFFVDDVKNEMLHILKDIKPNDVREIVFEDFFKKNFVNFLNADIKNFIKEEKDISEIIETYKVWTLKIDKIFQINSLLLDTSNGDVLWKILYPNIIIKSEEEFYNFFKKRVEYYITYEDYKKIFSTFFEKLIEKLDKTLEENFPYEFLKKIYPNFQENNESSSLLKYLKNNVVLNRINEVVKEKYSNITFKDTIKEFYEAVYGIKDEKVLENIISEIEKGKREDEKKTITKHHSLKLNIHFIKDNAKIIYTTKKIDFEENG